jgi:hypothetical protein
MQLTALSDQLGLAQSQLCCYRLGCVFLGLGFLPCKMEAMPTPKARVGK